MESVSCRSRLERRKWTGSVHQSSKGKTHPSDDGSSGPAQRHQQEGEQNGAEAHDSNLQHHCQTISPWYLTPHPWCGTCQREGPAPFPSLYFCPHPPDPSFPPPSLLPHVWDIAPETAQRRRRVAHPVKSNQTKVCQSLTPFNIGLSWHEVIRAKPNLIPQCLVERAVTGQVIFKAR